MVQFNASPVGRNFNEAGQEENQVTVATIISCTEWNSVVNQRYDHPMEIMWISFSWRRLSINMWQNVNCNSFRQSRRGKIVLGSLDEEISVRSNVPKFDVLQTHQANHNIRVLFVIALELKRSRTSPCLWVKLASVCSRSPSGICFRLKSATFWRFSLASLGLLCAKSQRGDSGRNLRLTVVRNRS